MKNDLDSLVPGAKRDSVIEVTQPSPPEKNLKNKQQQQATKLEQGNPPKHTPLHVEDGNPDRVPVFYCILQEKTKNDRIYAVIRDKSAGGERA